MLLLAVRHFGPVTFSADTGRKVSKTREERKEQKTTKGSIHCGSRSQPRDKRWWQGTEEKSEVVSGRKECWICQWLAAAGQTEKKGRCWE